MRSMGFRGGEDQEWKRRAKKSECVNLASGGYESAKFFADYCMKKKGLM